MSKTFKDKANHFKHHLMSEIKNNKAKYEEKDIPKDVKELVKTLSYNYAGLRYGNHRKMLSKLKTAERRIQRKRENKKIKENIFENE